MFTIGKLAQAAGVNVETVRYYERRGLLDRPPRPVAGYREYSDADLWRLQFIRRGKELGFTLAELAELLQEGSAEQVLAASRRKLGDIERKQRSLDALHRRVQLLADLCESGSDDCVTLRVTG